MIPDLCALEPGPFIKSEVKLLRTLNAHNM